MGTLASAPGFSAMPTPAGILLASSAAGTTMCGMAANGGTGSRPSQLASRPADVNAGTNSAPR
jgi:hypothetical protein